MPLWPLKIHFKMLKKNSFVFFEQNQCKIPHLKTAVGVRSKSSPRGLKTRSSFHFWLLMRFMRKAIYFWNILKISPRPNQHQPAGPQLSLCFLYRTEENVLELLMLVRMMVRKLRITPTFCQRWNNLLLAVWSLTMKIRLMILWNTWIHNFYVHLFNNKSLLLV